MSTPSAERDGPLRVWPVEHEFGRFKVQSQQIGKAPYLVDVLSLEGNGECDCKNFEHAHKAKALAALADEEGKRVRHWCKHLEAANLHFLEELKIALIRENKTKHRTK